ncbi:MAG: hypothetical protein IPM23_04320 [Candidatus Melainabacteria bacterium]|nr:hypothetical protein [Candidatus Melainabacteria bacterium]
MLRAFTVKHWDPEGAGSGCTVVVASSERMARLVVIEYLRSKPEGYRQCQSAELLEVEPHEDSHLSAESVDTSEPGVKLEYRMLGEAPFEEIVFFGFSEEDLAEELDRLQSGENQGRGVSCVRTLIFYLRRKEFDKAKAVARNESDKIRSYPEIVAVLKRVGFWYELSWT